jgi:hypothetical protein
MVTQSLASVEASLLLWLICFLLLGLLAGLVCLE